MSRKRRFLILAEGAFGPATSKTANASIRYTPDEVAVVLDSSTAGRSAQDVLGFGGAIPVVASFEEAMAFSPNALLIGIAPAGGQLPLEWRGLIATALKNGLDVWSGMHTLLSNDKEFGELARQHGSSIVDLRRPPADLGVSSGLVRDIDATVVLTVGTDCSIGKMTAQLQLLDSLRSRGHKVSFAATGQTGILIDGKGIAVDAVIADFIAGAAERITVEAAQGADIVLVEGQGSIVHPSYSGVTLGLLHGSMPHAQVLCAQPSRTKVKYNEWMDVPEIPVFIKLYEAIAGHLREAPVIGIALNTFDLSEDEALRVIEQTEKETGLPTADTVRFSPIPLVDAIDSFHRRRSGI